MFDSKHIALHQELLKEAEAKVALDPSLVKTLLAGGVGAAAGGGIAHLATRAHDERQREQTRNRAFGAGVAAGVAGPRVARGLYNIAQRNGLFPQSEMTP
jgi:TctA family transporter